MVRHVAGIAEIVENLDAAVGFYRDVLGLEVHEEGPGYAVVKVPGVLHFGLWDRRSAAESTFGDPGAVDRVPLGFTVGFEVDSVDDAHPGLSGQADVLQPPKDEPWGQRTCRWLSLSGALAEVTETPAARRLARDLEVLDGE